MKVEIRHIFDEYRASESAQVRRNLCTALAAVGDSDSLERLVNMAMSDADETVRDRARSEIIRLEPSKRDDAVAAVIESTLNKEARGPR